MSVKKLHTHSHITTQTPIPTYTHIHTHSHTHIYTYIYIYIVKCLRNLKSNKTRIYKMCNTYVYSVCTDSNIRKKFLKIVPSAAMSAEFA